MKTVFLRMLEAEDKAAALLGAVREPERARERQRFEMDPQNFASVPGSPFSYWVSERLRRLFKELPAFEGNWRTAKQGLTTADDVRFVRAWWAVAPETVGTKWFSFAKGGAFARFYSDVHLVVNWSSGGQEIYELNGIPFGSAGAPLRNPGYYFRPGLTWPHRGAVFSAAALPEGCVFSSSGKAAFVQRHELEATLGLFNSSAFLLLLRMQSDAVRIKFECGLISRTPVPSEHKGEAPAHLAVPARRGWVLNRSLDTRVETSHAFALPALLQVSGVDLAARVAAWSDHVRAVQAELADIQEELDERCFALYGIHEADQRVFIEGFAIRDAEEASNDGVNDSENDAGEDTDESGATADAVGLAAELVAWAVGVAVGRFDVRLATGQRPMPIEPEPFDPLPVCSPGMLAGREGLPIDRRPEKYPLAFPETGVLVDDIGHGQDLPTAVRAVFDLVFDDGTDSWWNDVAALLDPKCHDLRAWLTGSFFAHHLKRYSKSRRKAPILWQLGTPSGNYSVWLYAHRLTRDTFFQLQNQVVGPKHTHEERQLTSLIQDAGGSPSAGERKEIAAQEALVEELRAMLDEIKRVAPLWNPKLDDGVVLTIAPLWRLVPQNRFWQNELKSKWDELAAGKYDWAHLAMHLWPERVVPRCATDRSLAIAHGLDDVFWVEESAGKWTARKTPTRTIEELVRERSSRAVKAALKSLLEAPAAAVIGGRGRSGRRPAATSTAPGVNP